MLWNYKKKKSAVTRHELGTVTGCYTS